MSARRTTARPRRRLVPAAAVAVVIAGALALLPAVPVPAAAHQARPASGWSSAGWTDMEAFAEAMAASYGSGWDAPSTGQMTVTDVGRVIGAVSPLTSGLDGTGVGVALVDTGIVPVPGLPAAQVVNGPDLSFESQGDTVRYLDGFGHGTHLAGIIAGNDSSVGLRGLAPKVKLTSVKVGAADGTVDVSQVIAAVDWVVAHRNDDAKNPIRVLNLAYGTDGTQLAASDPLAFAVENAWRAGIVVVVAGGNGGSSTTTLTNPAYDPFVLAVGSAATKGTISTSDDELSDFTQVSTARKLDVVVPGESIVSLRDPNSFIDANYPSARVGTRLFRGSGTSQAAAVASGAVALLLQAFPGLTPDRVKSILKLTGSTLADGLGKTLGLREMNVAGAVTAAISLSSPQPARGTGTGSLELSRGSSHVMVGDTALSGENDIFGPWNSATWAAASAAGTAWQGGRWLGRQMAGDGWTGTSWASKTWGAAKWPTGYWGSAWADDNWSGRYWSGTDWSGRYWSGRYWSSSTWKNDTSAN